ncbi:S53 family peptidase [Dictyobacter kobayashii]|uniref:Pseudomonapepsin n=1 Tax=Dictyobacter kobayashii TaxID=2014872 RepID=A0A402AK25_9CHLR|nr:S53 family peptidase [Dictyobacter kobayashii]GCE19471.1 pseudomonapepsin [Dictyobacter kobayashii]
MFRYSHRSEFYPFETTQSYGRIITIITPLLTLLCVMSIVSSQLLHLTPVQADNANQSATIPGTLTPLLKSSQFIAHAETRQQIWLSIGLRPYNSAELQRTLQTLLQTAPRQPRVPLNPAALMQRFSPAETTYTELIRRLQNAGFHDIHTYKHRLLLDFGGTIGQAERYFHLQINTYKAPDGSLYYANNKAPQLPRELASQIVSINGLNNAATWRHTALEELGQARPTNNHPCIANTERLAPEAGLAPTYSLADLYRAHYTGSAQSIALFELGSSAIGDLHTYANCNGQQKTMLKEIDTAATASTYEPATQAATIDAEAILGNVPQLDELNIYTTHNDEKSYLDQWAQIVQDAPAVVSTSWGLCEQLAPAQLIQQEAIFFQFTAMQGQSILAASSFNCPQTGLSPSNQQVMVSDPASQPFVTAVGATALTFETAPNTPDTLQTAGKADPAVTIPTTSGGVSQWWAMPAWQRIQGIPNQTTVQLAQKCSRTQHESYCREVPDVAINADTHHGFWAYCSPGICAIGHPWLNINRTAVAAPLWASFVALSNQLAHQHGSNNLGFLNPFLYQLANNPTNYANSFYDIIAIDNNRSNSPGVGYDLASGLGEYRAKNLAQQLLALTQPAAK